MTPKQPAPACTSSVTVVQVSRFDLRNNLYAVTTRATFSHCKNASHEIHRNLPGHKHNPGPEGPPRASGVHTSTHITPLPPRAERQGWKQGGRKENRWRKVVILGCSLRFAQGPPAACTVHRQQLCRKLVEPAPKRCFSFVKHPSSVRTAAQPIFLLEPPPGYMHTMLPCSWRQVAAGDSSRPRGWRGQREHPAQPMQARDTEPSL